MTSRATSPASQAFLRPILPAPRRRQRTAAPRCVDRPPLQELLRPGLRELRVGSVVVPRHLWDLRMRQKGVYRSVEYVIERLTLDDELLLSTSHLDPSRLRDAVATLRPLNRLLPRFERNWPVAVTVAEAGLFSYKADLLSCALVTLAMSASFLGVGLFGPRVMSIYSIPSASMYPTLHVGDALLVEKLSLRNAPPHRGEIILFRPPSRLVRILRAAHESDVGTGLFWQKGLSLRRNVLFVKRVAAVGGDVIEVHGKVVRVNGIVVDKAAPGSPEVAPRRIPDSFLFVVGDNAERSIDSRYWGLLPVENVVGRPVARIFPLDRLDIDV